MSMVDLAQDDTRQPLGLVHVAFRLFVFICREGIMLKLHSQVYSHGFFFR